MTWAVLRLKWQHCLWPVKLFFRIECFFGYFDLVHVSVDDTNPIIFGLMWLIFQLQKRHCIWPRNIQTRSELRLQVALPYDIGRWMWSMCCEHLALVHARISSCCIIFLVVALPEGPGGSSSYDRALTSHARGSRTDTCFLKHFFLPFLHETLVYWGRCASVTSASFIAEISVRSPRKLLVIFIM